MKLLSVMQFIVLALCVAVLPALAAQEFHGNPTSMIYHNSSCRYFDCQNCYVVFYSRKEAREAGFRACKICKG